MALERSLRTLQDVLEHLPMLNTSRIIALLRHWLFGKVFLVFVEKNYFVLISNFENLEKSHKWRHLTDGNGTKNAVFKGHFWPCEQLRTSLTTIAKTSVKKSFFWHMSRVWGWLGRQELDDSILLLDLLIQPFWTWNWKCKIGT